MPKLLFNQKGFTALEAILILVIVALLGGTGYYVYHAKQQTDNNLSGVSRATAVANSSSKNTTKFITISEWGIRIPVPDAAPDLYTAKTADDTGYTMSVHSLDSTDACAADKTGLAKLIRFPSKLLVSPAAGSTYTRQDITHSPIVGAYHYLIVSGNGTCTSPENKAWNVAHTAIVHLKNATTALPAVTP